MKKLIAFVLTVGFLAGCGGSGDTPLVSPSGRLKASLVEIPNPKNDKLTMQQVQILDFEDQLVYKDQKTEFSGVYDVHVAWDEDDRFWTYYEDTGVINFYEHKDGVWQKKKWTEFTYKGKMDPPPSILP